MNRLPTYFAALATILVALGGTAIVAVFSASPAITWRTVLALVGVLAVVFLFALLIGYFISEPLRTLRQKITAYRTGDSLVDFSPEGRLSEADALAGDFKDLLDTSQAQCADLARRQQQQMQFVGDVAHELRTPLTAIRGNAELLADPDLPDSMREKCTTTIVSEAERLTRLTNDLLSLQHLENDDYVHDMKRVNLLPVVQQAVDALLPVLESRQALVSVSGEAPDVWGNADRLGQVVSNLVDNASHFIEPGGHIDVELYGVDDNAVVAVKDDGTGFGDVDPKMLFERFFRTDFSRARNTGGSGLGLAIVKTIVEAHDGTVEAFNRPEGGACFIVAIPALPPENA